jgi:hypothetical protein
MALFRIHTEDQPQRQLVGICRSRNYNGDRPRIGIPNAPFKTSQHPEYRTDLGLILRHQVRLILTGAPLPKDAWSYSFDRVPVNRRVRPGETVPGDKRDRSGPCTPEELETRTRRLSMSAAASSTSRRPQGHLGVTQGTTWRLWRR